MLCFLLEEEEEGDEGGSILMDDEIWSTLPEELLFSVLACLPLSSFVRFRIICKRWNVVLRNPSSSPFFSFPPAFYNKPWAIFKSIHPSLDSCPTAQRSGHPLPQLCKSICPRCRKGGQTRLRWRPLKLDFLCPFDSFVSSHADLVLVLRTFTQYLVCNPLLQISRALPVLPIGSRMDPASTFTAIFGTNPASISFKIIWGLWYLPAAHAPRESIPSFLYNSANEEWRRIEGRPVVTPSIFEKNGTLCNNICYWPTDNLANWVYDFEQETWLTQNLEFLAFDFEQETWHMLKTKWVSEFTIPKHCRLWEWQGHLMMITKYNSEMMLWKLSEDNEWNALNTAMIVTHNTIINECLPFHSACMGNILLFYNSARKKLIAYNFVNKDLIISDVAHDSSSFSESFLPFHPSLEAHWS